MQNASATAQEILDHLHSIIDHFVNGVEEDCDSNDGSVSEDLVHNTEYMDSVWAADTLVLLNVLYPSSFEIGSTCLLEGISIAPHRVRQGSKPAVLSSILDEEDFQEVSASLAPNRENHDVCAWRGGLLRSGLYFDQLRLLRHRRRHKAAVQDKLGNGGQGCVARPFPGRSVLSLDASPLNASCPADVCRVHIDLIFVGDEETGVERASNRGQAPPTEFGPLMGSAIEDIKVNACLNEVALDYVSLRTLLFWTKTKRTK